MGYHGQLLLDQLIRHQEEGERGGRGKMLLTYQQRCYQRRTGQAWGGWPEHRYRRRKKWGRWRHCWMSKLADALP